MEFDIRPIRPDEVTSSADFVGRVFMACVAPLYSAEGVREFLSYASAESLRRRLQDRLVILVAVDPREVIVGLVGIRDGLHISLLFVESELQRSGIGWRLIEAAVEACKEADPVPTEVMVNASPNSVPAYERFGFVAGGPEQEKNGIRFVPMRLAVA